MPMAGIRGGIAIVEDITDKKKIERQLKYLAQTDPLTNLYNRRHFMEIADKEFARTLRYDTDLTVLMLDVDHFKSINDTHGHRTGDMALIELSQLCRNALRRHDIVGRLGGEEFAMLLPQTAREQGMVVAEKLRALIDDNSIPLEGGASLHFTVSIGLASLSNNATNLDSLINQADTALYSAKNSGRNRVCEYSPTSSS